MPKIVKAVETESTVRFQGYSVTDEQHKTSANLELERPNEWIESTHVINLPWR